MSRRSRTRYTGFDIYDSYNCGKACERFKRGADWVTIGGTSLATPLVSALYALAGGATASAIRRSPYTGTSASARRCTT